MNQTECGTLYVVGTPIGNLSDFSPRARETLEKADFIAAEDTRVTLKLLNHFGIHKPMISYFERPARWFPMRGCLRFRTRVNCWSANAPNGEFRYMWCPGPAR